VYKAESNTCFLVCLRDWKPTTFFVFFKAVNTNCFTWSYVP
jgi:hypothetical protein